DKSKLNIPETINKVNGWLKKNYSNTSREWAYSKAAENPMIIVEDYIENSPTSLDDYKIYCYNGKFRFLDLHKDRYYNHTRSLFNEQLEFIPDVKGNYATSSSAPSLPENIQEMITIAEKLAKPFPFVRVDLYNIKGKIYFGELTFYPASGFSPYTPDSFDYELGKFFPDKNDQIWTNYNHVSS
ncbi:MAG: carbonic anhydrase, partial [Muribaculaceae bacterium]|nr:carbonic anhydrase [Muribaculaceae bacterium]